MKGNLYFTKMDTNLLLFLEKKLPNRASRFEAFLDLLKHQINHCDGHPNGINIPVGITYESLAKEWNWDRKTVMSFLKSLQEMGVLECKRDGYNMVVRLLIYPKRKDKVFMMILRAIGLALKYNFTHWEA